MTLHKTDLRLILFCVCMAGLIGAMFLQAPVLEPTQWVGTNPLPGLPRS